MAEAYLVRAAAAGVCHAEVFLDPQAHTTRGIPLEEVLDGVSSALGSAHARHGISTGLIITMLRDHSAESAMQTLDDVLRIGASILGIGLDSAGGRPPAVEVRGRLRQGASRGLHVVAHAGEEARPSTSGRPWTSSAAEADRPRRALPGRRPARGPARRRRSAAHGVPVVETCA